jgi:EAL domain-containing protein (putative c-di-GMP-specific phosphodiesterase class I)
MERSELVPWFQPIVRLSDGGVVGYEALVRWHHPERGVLSPAQFKGPGLVQSVSHALAESGLSPQRLELEITESVLLNNSVATLAILHALRDRGIRISMDDFGTGYSSLSYLRSFPFDKIKIDQSFVRDVAAAGESSLIVRAIIGLSRSLGMQTTAEGVETEEQLARLRAEGCDEVQGYLFGMPSLPRHIPKLLKRNLAVRSSSDDSDVAHIAVAG